MAKGFRTSAVRALRVLSTPAEQRLWELLRNRGIAGAKFRRQHPIAQYFVDFYCCEARLVVEADGNPHYPRPVKDIYRDANLRRLGIRVLRFENREILEDTPAVLAAIRRALAEPPLISEQARLAKERDDA
ncbi:MAG: putative nucleotidyltransferase protein [Labilithrix sp.]|nr:putative nucleotidyltransferase protein [Labilithrix sp.]